MRSASRLPTRVSWSYDDLPPGQRVSVMHRSNAALRLTLKLDYINDGNARSTRSLGARCIWLMPIDASPSYHGYDVKNYYRVNPEYGNAADFKRLVAEAHRRGIR